MHMYPSVQRPWLGLTQECRRAYKQGEARLPLGRTVVELLVVRTP
jgi:hypothetical protein